jgi:3-polyprenyl-4-hydroxybenzoate decarboxylase
MAYASFSQFLSALEKAGELKRVTIPAETDSVIAEWADREMKSRVAARRSSSNSR